MWGGLELWIDGVYADNNYIIHTDYNNFNNTGDSYKYSYPTGISSGIYGYMKAINGTNNSGFIMKSSGGSETTYYSDNNSFFSGVFLMNHMGDESGIFSIRSISAAAGPGYYPTPRLVYKHKQS